jgi:hypothetical protein
MVFLRRQFSKKAQLLQEATGQAKRSFKVRNASDFSGKIAIFNDQLPIFNFGILTIDISG